VIYEVPKLASDEPALRISKLEREMLHDPAYLEVKKAIMSGAIRPGTTITIRAMAAALGTSPMPVRESLSCLVAERALVMLPTRSVTVPLMRAEQFDEISRIRIAMEGMVAEKATTLLNSETLRQMQQAQIEMSRLKPQHTSVYLAKKQGLHFTLYRAARMPVAMQMIESLWLQAGPLLNLALSEISFRSGQDHHRALLEALEKRSIKAARSAIEADITDAARIIREFLATASSTAAGWSPP
jgi:DNA-binding GntR family transcriptional regulator